MHDEQTRLTRSQVKDVIERAARMTELDDSVSVADLRHIADELDLDPVALDAALQQVLSERHKAGGRLLTARLFDVPDASRLRQLRPAVLTAFVAAAALITPGDLVPLTALLAGSMATLYEVCIALLSIAQSRRGGGPPSASPQPSADASSTGLTSVRDPMKTDEGLGRFKASILSIEDGVRAFQIALRGI